MKKVKKIGMKFGWIVAPMMITACSVHNEEFDCQAGRGVGCKTVSQVNKMLNEGQIALPDSTHNMEHRADVISPNANLSLSMAPKILPPVIKTGGFSSDVSYENIVLSDSTIVQRRSEVPVRIWVAPYQDENGDLHESRLIHSILKSSHWQMAQQNA
jgi:conjugal transfer pilus assembly protein TraV